MKLKDSLFLVCMGILACCALIFTGMFVKSQYFPAARAHLSQKRPIAAPQKRHIKGWKKLPLDGQRAGPADAPVRIVEFFDYECPYCKRSQPIVKALRRKYPQKVSVIHENFPLQQIHPYAYGAAIAAECARRQKPQVFMDYHDSLYARQKLLGAFSYVKLAAEVGISDTTVFRRCIKGKQTAGIIKDGIQLAGKLNVHGIPTFLINGTLVTGVLSEKQMAGLVQDALSKVAR